MGGVAIRFPVSTEKRLVHTHKCNHFNIQVYVLYTSKFASIRYTVSLGFFLITHIHIVPVLNASVFSIYLYLPWMITKR